MAAGLISHAQNSYWPEAIDLASIKTAKKIRSQCVFYADTLDRFTNKPVDEVIFSDTISTKLGRRIPGIIVHKYLYLKFQLFNRQDSLLEAYFLPGFYFDDIVIYQKDSGDTHYSKVDTSLFKSKIHTGYKRMALNAHSQAFFIVKMRAIKTTVNTLDPFISQTYYLPSLINNIQNGTKLNQTITYLITGFLLMMIIYSLAVFSLNGNTEFIFYTGHALFLGILFFLKAFLFKNPSSFNYFFESYLDFIFQCTGIYCYLIFLKIFLGTGVNFPLLHKMLTAEQIITLLGVGLFTYVYYFSDNFVLQNQIEMWIKYLWSVATIYLIVFAFYAKEKLLNYIAWGHFFLFVSGLLSLYLINSTYRFGNDVKPLLNDSLFYYEVGIVIELTFFLVALAYKNKRSTIERTREGERLLLLQERNEMEKQMAIVGAKQEERNRISADMHDELGSGVTAIRLMSELVKSKMGSKTLPEIEKISMAANDLITKMNTIIWTMKSSNDRLDNLVAYIRAYAIDFFDSTVIDCHFDFPPNLPITEVSGEKRRNLFLCVKESLNNVAKHSRASDVWIEFLVTPTILTICIKDNGVGIEQETIREFGNGLENMKKRMNSIHGDYHIINHQGTTTTLTMPLSTSVSTI